MKVGFISGTSIYRSNLFARWRGERIPTAHGEVVARVQGNVIVINRHGFETPLPPHAINYRANVSALQAFGATEVVSLNSVGSLREDLPPGTLVSCHDYVSFAPVTFHDDMLKSLAPVVPNRLVPQLLATFDQPVRTGMVYVQTRGPRFETRAEVRILRQWGDVVGMTMANEADLCQEAGIGYNSFCVIDNYAHGVSDHVLSPEEFQRLVAANQERVNHFVAHLLGRLAG